MQKSESIAKLATALVAVQSQLTPAKKDSENPFFKSSYADLNSVWDSCRGLLAKNGLSVIQGNSVGIDNTVIVETILAHTSGEWVQSELCLPTSKTDKSGNIYSDAQTVGSAITYGRRYGLAAIVGIVADADDDGNAASKAPKGQQKAPLKAVEQPTAREGLVRGIEVVCKALNESKDSITWTRVKTNEYIEAMFKEGINLDTANEAQLRTVTDDLQARLKTLREAA